MLTPDEKQIEELGHACLLYRRLLVFLAQRYAGGRATMTADDLAELAYLKVDIEQKDNGETVVLVKPKFPTSANSK